MVLNRFVVVSGLPASGKSTLARTIADALRLPRLDKDDLLERLFETLGVGDLEWRRQLSRAADDELRRQACALPGAVIVSWWRHPHSAAESGTPTEWLSTLSGELVELHCVCSPSVAASRFVGRKRHAGHLDEQKNLAALQASFEEQALLGPLKLGRVLEVNTEVSPQTVELLTKIEAAPEQGGQGMTDLHEVRLEAATAADLPLLSNLLELYIHDLSAAFPGVELGPDGRFGYPKLALYESEPDRRFSFLIRCGGRVAGFALVTRGSPATEDPEVFDVAEFFVIRSCRRSGVGRRAALLLWNRLPGRWIVRVSEGNPGAVPFWDGVIAEFTKGVYAESTRPGSPQAWRVFSFSSVG